MYKKAQVAMFVIISVIILALGTFLILQVNQNQQIVLEENRPSYSDPRLQQIENTISSCLELEIEEQLYFNLLSGGFYELPLVFAFDSYLTVPFYVYDNQVITPPLSVFEEQLELAINDNIEFCIDGLDEFRVHFQEISIGDFSSRVTIMDKRIIAQLMVPITLESSQDSFSMELFEVEVFSNVKEQYELVREFIQLHNGDFSRIPLSELNILAMNNNFRYEMKPQNFDVAIYNFIFEDDLRENPIEFQFAVQYNWEFS